MVGSLDQLAQQFQREPGRLLLRVLNNNLSQDHPRQVLARLGVHHLDFAPLAHGRRHVAQIYVLSRRRVVKPPRGIPFD